MKHKSTIPVLTAFILIISLIVTFLFSGETNLQRFADSWFIVSGLVATVVVFRYILDQGGFDLFRYNVQKTKRHVLFFLPKYQKGNEKYNEEETFDTFDEYVEYRESKIWKNMSALLVTSITHLILSIILSLTIYYKIIEVI